jgi:uncharacterized protein
MLPCTHMDSQTVISTLQAHQKELKELGIEHLALFGSVARGEMSPDSDVDLLATFIKSKPLSLLKVIGIERKISEILGCPVDLGEASAVKPHVKPYIEQSLINVF